MIPSPPAGEPWDLPLEGAPLAFVDLEMTGLDPKTDRVIEVCVERVRGSKIEARLHTLVRPETLVEDAVGNAHVHGILAEALREAPLFADIATQVGGLFEGAVLVAHGAPWDVAFLEASMDRAGQPLRLPFYIDTLNLSRRALGLKKHSLDSLREHFGLDRSRSHRADADVEALRTVWEKCVAALEPKTPRDVWDVRVADRKAREHILAECIATIATGTAVTVFYRSRGKPQEPLRMVLVEVVEELDPPRVIGYQLPGRGRRELRTDRILRIERVAQEPPPKDET